MIKPGAGGSIRDLQTALAARHAALARQIAAKIPARLKSVITVEDVLQEVRIAAFQAWPTFEARSPDAFDRWIKTITRTTLIDALRAATAVKRGGANPAVLAADRRRTSLADLFERVVSNEKSPSRQYSVQEAACAVQAALEQMPPTRREALRLRYLEGRSREEIAKSTGRSICAVDSLLYNARLELRDKLGEAFQFFSDAKSSGHVPK